LRPIEIPQRLKSLFYLADGMKGAIFSLKKWRVWGILGKTGKASSNWQAKSAFVKIRLLNQKVIQCPPQGRAGMTLIEVVVALALAGLMVAGIVTGYIFCTTSTVKDSLYMAANARVTERLEQTRAAIWAPYRAVPVDQLVATNFPDENNVTLDLAASDVTPTLATIHTDITPILPSASSPNSAPVRRIHVDCIWQFKGQLITNSIETCRAPDQ
jgi:prepilin-type N-terminal cleavage/methylation domain-containing protein